MASFYAYDFMFDDIPSQRWDLKIITFEDGGLFSGVGSSDVNIITQRVLRKSKPYYLGRTQEPVLEFPLTFGTSRPISGYERDVISSWLFGRSTYKRLYILQDDLNGAYFNCFLTKPEPLYIGNMNFAFTCTVVCDSPWAFIPTRTLTKNFVSDGSIELEGTTFPTWNGTYGIYNFSSEDDYLYPEVSITFGDGVFSTPTPDYLPSYGIIQTMAYASLINTTDDASRETTFTGVCAYQTFQMNNDLQILTTNQEYPYNLALGYFNKNWFRLVPKYNEISIEILGIDSGIFTFTLNERMKIGG